MAAVVITSQGLIAPSGDAPEPFFEGLFSPFPPSPPQLFETRNLEPVPVFEVRDFDPQRYLGDQNFRPLNRPALFTIAAVKQALERGGWDADRIAETDVGLVLGTMFGSVHTISDFDLNALKVGPKYAKPLDFANTVINAIAGQTAIWYKLTGINSTIAAGATSGLHAIGYAAGLIESGRTQALLAGGVEELCFEAYLGFARLGRMGHGATAGCAFAETGSGFLLGEGAGLLMLESALSARKRGVPVLAQVSGFASGFDARRGQDPELRIATLVRAIRAAVEHAGLRVEDIDACFASANGCADQGALEAQALARLFAASVPITSLKLRSGEALGASGGLAANVAVEALRRSVLPCTDQPRPGAAFLARSTRLRHVLLHGVGFDGSCCALIISAPDPIPPPQS